METNIIVPRLKGGLCNQLFTIAAAYATAKKTGSSMAINYGIQHVGGQGHAPLTYKDTLYKNILQTTHMPSSVYNEPAWEYSPIPFLKDAIIDGYFQSEKHFDTYSDEIKELFYFPDNIKQKVDSALKKIEKKILCIHVRLGDYVLPAYASTHFVCNRDYYIKALEHFNLDDYTILVCTDSADLYQKHINIENAILCNSSSDLEDLYIISQSDACILTNSTFSWWGSYLGKSKEKICAPSRWFGVDGPKKYVDIYRDDWIIIPV